MKISNTMLTILSITIMIISFVNLVNSQDEEKIQVIIEHKSMNQDNRILPLILSNINKNTQKYEIRNITKKEYEQLKKDDSIIIQENIPKTILLAESIPLIETDKVWNITENQTNITGASQTVCILDTGVQTDHPYLTGKNATCNIDCVGGKCIEDCSATDNNGHGTHVTGIILSNKSNLHGATLQTKYIPLIVCDENGSCYDIAIQSALDWCIANKDTYNISVISMSVGTEATFSSYCDPSFPVDSNKINSAVSNNISVVVATGNAANTSGISEPACIQNSIRVGNTYDSNVGSKQWTACSDSTTSTDKITCNTNRASFFSDIIFAPGAMINSSWINSGTEEIGGTSMSTPHVSGIIALLNQYKKLESNKTLTPNEIKNILFNSGKTIYDSPTDTNYSRVNAYQSILYSDEKSPQVNIIRPTNNSLVHPANTTFNCNATDNLQLKNLTISIYNSTNLVYQFSNSSISENSLTINKSFNLSQSNQTYYWNCLAFDNKSNLNQSVNRTIHTNIMKTQIILPDNNTYTNTSNTQFNCSSKSITELSNITFYLYQNDTLLLNQTKNISGKTNYSLFNYNLTNETNYIYLCESSNNQSEKSTSKNHTITYDNTSPKISLAAPQNSLRTTAKTINFQHTQNETNPNYCNLTINSQTKSSFTQTLSDGNYIWNIKCIDLAGNLEISESRNLEIYTQSSSSSSSTTSSSSSSTPTILVKTYKVTEEEIKNGITKDLKPKDSVEFKIKSANHKLTLNKINNNSVDLTIKSEPINLTVYLNSPTQINLDNDDTFDIQINLLDIQSYAIIQIKEINKTIPQKIILQNQTENKEATAQKQLDKIRVIEIALKIIVIIIITYLVYPTIKPKKIKANKTKKKHGKTKNKKTKTKTKHKR